MSKQGMIAYEIMVNGSRKHIGKVAMAPAGSHDAIQCRMVMYKEVDHKDIFCRATNSFSIDKYGFDEAMRRTPFDALVVRMPDADATFFIWSNLVTESRIVDLGERPQYRFPLGMCSAIKKSGLHMGWTTNVVILDAPLVRAGGGRHIDGGGPISLFDTIPSEDSRGQDFRTEAESLSRAS